MPQEERGAAASFHSSKSLQLQSPIQLESRSSESLKKDVKPRGLDPEKDSSSPVTNSTPTKRRLPGNHGLTAPVMLDSKQMAAKLPQWRVVINSTASPLASSGETTLAAKPQTPHNQTSSRKRKHTDDGQTPKVNQAVKRPRKRYASTSEVPSTPGSSPRHKRQPSVESGEPVPTSAEKSVEEVSTSTSKVLVEVVKTPVKKAVEKSTTTAQAVKISETPAKSPKGLTSDEKPLSKSTPPKSTLVKPPKAKNTRPPYENMSTQAIFNAEIDQEAFSTEMDFAFPWLDDDEQVPCKSAKSTALVHVDTPSPKASRGKVPEPASKAATEADKAGIEEMHRYLDYCEKKFGLSGSEVIQAVECTSGVKANIEILLRAISKGEEPADIPGIWNKEDDEVLMGSDSRKMKELSDRKGDTEITRRMDFLNLWNLA